MERLFLRREEVASKYAVSSWQSVMFSEFEAQMSSEARPFPCVFGVAGHRQDQLRYLFLDPYDVDVLGGQLAQYVSESRSYGPNTSLIVFTRPRPVQTLDAYYRKMWLTLDQLARLDKSPWPAEIPAHVMRQSRRSSAFMLTFQPRWVFEKILGTEKAANAAFAEVRKRLIPYDSASPSPHLGRYGASDGREYQQYFLHDDNNAGGGCPFAKLAQSKASPIEDKEQAA
jgi:FPC/CPF motif-containing protein YcgG